MAIDINDIEEGQRLWWEDEWVTVVEAHVQTERSLDATHIKVKTDAGDTHTLIEQDFNQLSPSPFKKFTVEVSLENEAFFPDYRDELGRILKSLAGSMWKAPRVGPSFFPIYDINGNKVGEARIE